MGEYTSGTGGAAAPSGRAADWSSGAIGVLGPAEELFGLRASALRPPLAAELLAAADAVGHGVSA